MSNNYTVINRYNSLINKVQKNNNMDDSAVGDLKWSIRYDDFRGWLRCDGREVNISTYPALYQLLQNAFGNPSNSEKFKLPDARRRVLGMANINGEVLSGYVNSRLLGNVTGAETHTLSLGEMPTHVHTGTTNLDGSHQHSYIRQNGTQDIAAAGGGTTTAAEEVTTTDTTTGTSTHQHNFTTQSNGGGQAHNNMQPTLFIGHVFIYAGNYFDENTNDDDPTNDIIM